MNTPRLPILLLLALGMLLAGCVSTTGASPFADTAVRAREQPERQLLVMLRMPPPHFHPDANYGTGYGMDPGRNARSGVAADVARVNGLTLVADWPMPVLGIHCFVMQEQDSMPPDDMAAIVSRDPRVEWAQPLRSFHARSDPLYPLQPAASAWRLTDIHRLATGRNVRVAVIDSGVEADHPDLAGQVESKENFVDGTAYVAEAHGTAVAGIIAARGGNGVGIEGVAPDVRLLALRACWNGARDTTECNSFTLGKALHAAIMLRADVINLSIAGPSDRLLQRLLDAALDRGTRIVAAADPNGSAPAFPASYPGVLVVSDQATAASAANVLIAPGRDIPTTVPPARWGLVSGSSFAAAHVSGLIALLRELKPQTRPNRVRDELVVSSNGAQPAGTIDACATIAQTTGNCSCSCVMSHAATIKRQP